MIRGLAVALILLLPASSYAGSSYRYRGVRAAGRTTNVRLVSASADGGHAAVWAGVSNVSASRWLQAGVEFSGGEPQVYIEIQLRRYSLREWPVRFGERVRVVLVHHGDMWRVGFSGEHSHWAYIHYPVALSALEIYGSASGVALVDGRRISS